jgi:hypothetical protein
MQSTLLRLAQYGDGARAPARFNIQSCGTHKMFDRLVVWTLKRRERRAPLAPLLCHSILRGSLDGWRVQQRRTGVAPVSILTSVGSDRFRPEPIKSRAELAWFRGGRNKFRRELVRFQRAQTKFPPELGATPLGKRPTSPRKLRKCPVSSFILLPSSFPPQRRRRGIFVEPRTKKNPSPGGAA